VQPADSRYQAFKHLSTKIDFYLAGLLIELHEITGVTAAGIGVPCGDDARLLNGSTLR